MYCRKLLLTYTNFTLDIVFVLYDYYSSMKNLEEYLSNGFKSFPLKPRQLYLLGFKNVTNKFGLDTFTFWNETLLYCYIG